MVDQISAGSARVDAPSSAVAMWMSELERARKDADKRWMPMADRAVDRYALKDSGDNQVRPRSKYNILYSNVQTMQPALYDKPPKVVAKRRFLDKDPIGRIASRIIQRAVQYQIDLGELDDAMRLVVKDKLIAGRGQLWCRYVPTIEPLQVADSLGAAGDDQDDDIDGVSDDDADDGDGGSDLGDEDDQADEEYGNIVTERCCVEFVNRKDFRHEPARIWPEVGWVARRAYMNRSALRKRFPKKDGAGDLLVDSITMSNSPDGMKSEASTFSELEKAEIWEIWIKETRKVVWIADGCPEVLDEKDDWLKLDGFFPCPRPLYAILTTDSLMPITDYEQYRPQAEQMDNMTQRAKAIIEACRVLGLYDESIGALEEMFKNDETTLHPVENWAAFQQGGGFTGNMAFLPLDMFVKALNELQKAKQEVKQEIYEISGISDILRGQGDPEETATGIATKSRHAELRLRDEQKEVARFVLDVVRIMAEVTAEMFQPQTLAEMSSAVEMSELQMPAPPPGMMMPPMMGHNGGPPMASATPIGIGH